MQTWNTSPYTQQTVGDTTLTLFQAMLKSLQSNFSGATQPSNPVAGMWWYDTTSNILKLRNEANSAWISVFDFANSKAVNADKIDGFHAYAYDSPTANHLVTLNGSAQFPASVIPSQGGIDVQEFDSSGTWTKPSGITADSHVLIRLWGAGASGARDSSSGGGGGGGGAYNEFLVKAGDLSATETVTIGSGGAAQSSDHAGIAGGNTTFGSLFTAYGGGPGDGLLSKVYGGGGGGVSSSGENGDGAGSSGGDGGNGILLNAVGSDAGEGASGHGAGDSYFGGGGGGDATEAYEDGGNSHFGGGGGGGSTSNTGGGVGGNSVFGGGGGGGGASDSTPGAGAGGTSIVGGNGGAGGHDSNNATAGTQPGGGGGGSEDGDSGAGADGMAIVITLLDPS